MINPTFLEMYKQKGEECFKSDHFWKLFKVSTPQALFDRNYLYGALVTATVHMQHKTIIKYEKSQDGILAWDEFKEDYDYDGSKMVRVEQLEDMAKVSYNNREP